MPRLANIFARRQKRLLLAAFSFAWITDVIHLESRPRTLFVDGSELFYHPGRSTSRCQRHPNLSPSSPNGKNKNSSSRNGLGGFFGRKKSQTVLSPTNYVQEEPQPASLLSTLHFVGFDGAFGLLCSSAACLNAKTPPHRMGPALSTRSLPTLQTASSLTLPLNPLSPLSSEMVAGDKSSGNTGKSVGGKSGRRFAFWTRGAEDSLKKDGEPNGGGGRNEDDDLLHHPLSTPSPSPSHSQDDISRRPRPRERGGSDASNASSRISVAAFREAVAKRERERETGRMSPSFGVGGGAASSISNVSSATANPQGPFVIHASPLSLPLLSLIPLVLTNNTPPPTDESAEDQSDSDSDNAPPRDAPPRLDGPGAQCRRAALTATKPGVASVNKERGKDGFTGGGMLGGGGGRRGEQQTPVLTSRSPPVRSLTADSGTAVKATIKETALVHFPSPPTSPVREVPPPLQSTTGASVTMKKDALRERLRAVVGGGEDVEEKEQRFRPHRQVDADAVFGTRQCFKDNHLHHQHHDTLIPTHHQTSTARLLYLSFVLVHHRGPDNRLRFSTAPKRTWADEKNDTYRDSVLASDLAAMLGGGIALVSVGLDDEEGAGAASRERDAVSERTPSPAFSVTSRPAHAQNRGAAVELGGSSGTRSDVVLQTRERSSSAVITAGASFDASGSSCGDDVCVSASNVLFINASCGARGTLEPSLSQQRTIVSTPRSSTLLPAASTSASTSTSRPSPLAHPIFLPRQPRPSIDTYRREQQLAFFQLVKASCEHHPPPLLPPRRPFVPSGRLSPTSSTGESSSDPRAIDAMGLERYGAE
ncbi:hypothetical protein R3P38DRAFT_3298852 [Favolaschia claudopus]|uniref:Uncharacterized protein n=1 Tax=Favolaschia claudopus TaxID=2862362 RepID=A0AAV9Z270_9AGAR